MDDPKYKAWFKYQWAVDFYNPACKISTPTNCLELNIKELNGEGLIDMGHEKMCVKTSFDNTKALSDIAAGLMN